jgi:hypothetical protein
VTVIAVHELLETVSCRFPGCPNEATSRSRTVPRGPFRNVCDDHWRAESSRIAEARAARRLDPEPLGPVVASARKVVTAARRLERTNDLVRAAERKREEAFAAFREEWLRLGVAAGVISARS